jgi:glycosyltransferase involved in cell wall biosynthesis
MRIAIVAPLVTPIREPQLGGSQALLSDIASGLTDRGHDVDVYAARGSAVQGARVIDTGVDAERLSETLFRAGESARATPESRDAFIHVYEMIDRGSYELVHNHAFDPPAYEEAIGLGVPVVHTLHLPPDGEVAEALALARRRSEAPTVVACVSRRHADSWSHAAEIDLVLPNGVPVDRIEWSPDGGEVLLFAGRFSAEKGAAEAIAIARLANVPLVLVGSPYDQEYAEKFIEPHRGTPGVDVCDALPRTELWAVMAASRAVLCPVSWDEPFGLVAAESQAAGTPVVAFKRGGLVDVVVDGVTGALVGDAEAAAGALASIGTLDRRACRRHAEKNLSLDATLDAHEDLYERVAGRSHTRIT